MNILDTIKQIFSATPIDSQISDLTRDEKALLSQISAINRRGGNLSPELYQKMRDFEMDWLERHYDFNTIEGINSIPVSPNLPCAPAAAGSMKGHTGEVYYYLRHKAYTHEDAGNYELALACMRKSVALVLCRNFCSTDDCYPLVKMLARFGFTDEAYRKKREIDKQFGILKIDDSIINAELKRRQEMLDFEWIQDNLPDKAPKNITGYRRMKMQNTKNFLLLKQLAAEKGRKI